MTKKVDPEFAEKLSKFGIPKASACFNCGNCTAVCSLSSENIPFPRKTIRYLQLGLKDKLMESPEPWLCYYCGDCSQTCPRNADPGEIMMGLRRYLTAMYDWTGISRLFYTSKVFEIFALLLVASLVGLGFYYFHGPIVTERVALNTFADNHVIEILDLLLLALLSFFLLTNAYRMAKSVMGDRQQYNLKGFIKLNGIPFSIYLKEFKEFVVQFFTQKKFLECNSKTQKIQWFVHFLIMTGYCTAFFLVVVALRWFQRDEIYSVWHPIRLLGYYATFAILYGVTYAILGRIKKRKTVYKYSHSSDWVFLIMLWLTTFTGILVHIARLLEMPLTTYYIYVIHLMIAVPMLVIEVPFAKWAHQLYRPLILFLVKVKQRAVQTES